MMTNARNNGWLTKHDRTDTVATAWVLPLTPKEARDPIRDIWMIRQKTITHLSCLTLEKTRTSEIPATRDCQHQCGCKSRCAGWDGRLTPGAQVRNGCVGPTHDDFVGRDKQECRYSRPDYRHAVVEHSAHEGHRQDDVETDTCVSNAS